MNGGHFNEQEGNRETMEAATSAALLELAATEAGTAAKSAAGAALPATVRKKRDRPTDWDPDRPLEKWQVGGLEFQNPSDGPVELRRQIEEAKEWIELSRRSEEQALRLKTAPGVAEWMWPGITTRYVLRERRPCATQSADGRRYLGRSKRLGRSNGGGVIRRLAVQTAFKRRSNGAQTFRALPGWAQKGAKTAPLFRGKNEMPRIDLRILPC